jgi:hypothetical protein
VANRRAARTPKDTRRRCANCHGSGRAGPFSLNKWAPAIYKQSADNYRNNSDGINCLPPGPRTSLSAGSPVKIVQTPKLVIFLYEYQTLFR